MNYRPNVKVCCIASLEEAELALAHGAAALGLVSAMPSGPGVISEDVIAAIAAAVPAETFLLTALQTADLLVSQHGRCGTTTLQLVDHVPHQELRQLRGALPHVHLVQVIHVRDLASVQEAVEVAPFVDALLLDSGNPGLQVKELGGTGRTHDWTLSRQIREAVRIPVWLAGGLHSNNVAEAVETVMPYGLDVCSGLRTNGNLDTAKLEAFFAVVHGWSRTWITFGRRRATVIAKTWEKAMRLLLAGLFSLALAGAPPDATDCVACHETVDLEKFRKLTHGGLACIKCHTAIKELPHPEKLPPVQCVRCHDHQAQEYAESVHVVARMQGKDHAATCNSCHGPAHQIVSKSNPASRVAKKNMNATCGKCHTPAFLAKLSTRLMSRASRMDITPSKK